jgi:Xaa-Pro aminopeptidase
MTEDLTPETTSEQPLADRGSNRSQRPGSAEFVRFITSGWGERPSSTLERSPAADHTAARRSALSARFPGERLVIPAGTFKPRSNDTDYRFRPHSAFAHLTGLGMEQEPDAVLVLHPVEDGAGDDGSGHHAVLYIRPLAGRDTVEFFSDARYGEFWVGARPTLEDLETATGIRTAHLDDLRDALAKDVGEDGVQVRVLPGSDEAVEELVEQIRATEAAGQRDEVLAEALSELRLVKDAHEIEQMRLAVDTTIDGFEKIVRALPEAIAHQRGERVIEGTFIGHARQEGNAVGYETIAAAGEHATTLHWIDNDGQVRPGDLVLVDAGVEVDSLYTADLTRTLPVDGTFTEVQRRIYQAVRDAADAGFAAAVPGARFRDVHDAAMKVIAARLAEWGLLPVSAEEALLPDNQHHRRWMVHGTSHHLGLDVHDCAVARAELYLDGVLEPGMVFTIEPGLYFKSDDLLVPAEYRGIGVRIEDDVLITADGNENLSAALPREPDAVEAWMAELLGR